LSSVAVGLKSAGDCGHYGWPTKAQTAIAGQLTLQAVAIFIFAIAIVVWPPRLQRF
jgi:hypothetical protein